MLRRKFWTCYLFSLPGTPAYHQFHRLLLQGDVAKRSKSNNRTFFCTRSDDYRAKWRKQFGKTSRQPTREELSNVLHHGKIDLATKKAGNTLWRKRGRKIKNCRLWMNKITTSGKAKTPPGRFTSQSVVGQEEQCSSTFSSFRHRVSRESWIHHLESVLAERQNMSINHLNFFFIQTASSALITHIIKTAFRREV